VFNLHSGVTTQLTPEGASFWPIWTPDGRRVAYRSLRPSSDNLFWIKTDGSGDEQQLTATKSGKNAFGWTSDGKGLIFEQDSGPPTGFDILLLSTEGERKVRPLLNTNRRVPPSFIEERKMARLCLHRNRRAGSLRDSIPHIRPEMASFRRGWGLACLERRRPGALFPGGLEDDGR
jgi:hypothetical protein